MTRLSALLPQVGHRPVVVVTDRYPPECYGGAEQSLHILLQGMPQRAGLLVVTFHDGTGPGLDIFEGVTVLRLPRDGGLQGAFGLRVEAQDWHPGGGNEEALGLVAHARRTMRPRGGVVADFAELVGGPAQAQLCQVLQAVQPKLVHADNYRAITLVAHAVEAAAFMSVPKLVGWVRDNRFHCPRYDQSNAVAGRLCGPCGFECASEDAPGHAALQTRLLEQSRLFRQRSLRRFDRVVVTSRFLQRAIEGFMPQAHIVRISNAADDGCRVAAYMQGVAEQPGTNVAIVGMLNECKGQLPVVRRLRELVSAVPDIRLHLAGRGDRLQRHLVEQAARQGLQDRLVLHGFVEREALYKLYRECQLVVAPAVWAEPFGRVPLEAGLAQRPVVSFAVGGLKETILDGVTGYLVPPGDYEALLGRIRLLAEEPARRRAMGAAAYHHVQEGFAAADVRAQVAALWSSLVAGARGSHPSFSDAS